MRKQFILSALLGFFTLHLALAQNIEKNKAVYRAIVEAINTNKLDALDTYLAKDMRDHSLPPGLPGGLEGTKNFVKMFNTAFPDGQIRLLDLIAEGDYVAAYCEFSGTQKGELMGIPATDKTVRYRSIDFVKFDNTGNVIEYWSVGDNMTLMQQLGLAPAAPPLPQIPIDMPAEAKSSPTSPEQNKMIAAKFFSNFSMRDILADMVLLSPNFKLNWNSDTKPYGPGTYKMLGETYLKAFSDIKWEASMQIAEGDKVASFTTFEATHSGPLMDIPATNKKISGVKGASIDRFVNGKIAERTQIGDDVDMLTQLGVIPEGK